MPKLDNTLTTGKKKLSVDLRKMEIVLATSSDLIWLLRKDMEVWGEGLHVSFGLGNLYMWVAVGEPHF